jgi:hypothetical protein
VLGSQALGVVERQAVADFQPLALVAVGWIALVVGLEPGTPDSDTPVSKPAIVAGLGFALGAAAAVFGGVWALMHYGIVDLNEDPTLSALAAACVAAPTTRHALRWVAERYGASGPLTNFLSQASSAGVAVPLIAMSAVFALAPTDVGLSVALSALLTLGLGVVLGLTTATLLGREFRRDESWTLLVGTALLGIGVAVRLGLSALSVTYMLGLGLRLASPHARALYAMVAPSEHAVLLPLLLLAGAALQPAAVSGLPLVVIVALLCRIGALTLLGSGLSVASSVVRRGGRLVGACMLPAGAVTIAVGMACAVRLPGALGPTVLCVAAAAALFGELLGPSAMRESLKAAGELRESAEQGSAQSTEAGAGSGHAGGLDAGGLGAGGSDAEAKVEHS